jgi:hypothetical protein
MNETLYVIGMKKHNGQAMRVNDRDDRYLLHNSHAHARRVIRWLGLSEVKVRPATPEEVAHGHIDTAKVRP